MLKFYQKKINEECAFAFQPQNDCRIDKLGEQLHEEKMEIKICIAKHLSQACDRYIEQPIDISTTDFFHKKDIKRFFLYQIQD